MIVIPPGLGLPEKGWSIHSKGYVIYTSRKTNGTLRRGTRLHREVFERVAGKKLDADYHVAHMDFDKRNCAPGNLLACPAAFNPSVILQDPYTGQFLSKNQWVRRYGEEIGIVKVGLAFEKEKYGARTV